MSYLPEFIRERIQEAQEKQLAELDLSFTQSSNDSVRLTHIPPEIFQLEHLRVLNLSGHRLASVPPEIVKLQNLTSLDLSRNQIEDIPDSIYELASLQSLSLINNAIKKLSRKIIHLRNLRELHLDGNPIEDPPPEIIAHSVQTIQEYFRSLEEQSMDHLYEAKLVLLGEAGAGKTTLINRILNQDYKPGDEEVTQGTTIKRWNFQMENGQPFRANIWDFGGQEIYHATHQLFLTKRSLYLLVVDTRREDTDLYYWLTLIGLLSDNSPVLIVKNEKQDRYREIGSSRLMREFPNLKAVLRVNLATGRGMEELLANIKNYISRLPHIGAPLPLAWVKVREALENSPRSYISLNEYLDICEKAGLTELRNKLFLSGYLHDLGVFLHFQDDPLLRKTLILRPTWAMSAIYKVLDNRKVIINGGKFNHDDLADIWHEAEYANMRDELLRLMINFKWCYRMPNSGFYIVPQLLMSTEPDYEWGETDNLNLCYTYEFMPKGIITQFIVAMHALIAEQQYVWRSGVILEREGAKAEVIEYYSNRKIKIRVAGEKKRELLAIINYEFEKIHSSFRRLKYDVLVPCNCGVCMYSQEPQFYPYETLVKFLENKQELIQCSRSFKMVNVRDLIDVLRVPSEQAKSIVDLPAEVVSQGLAVVDSYSEQGESQEQTSLYEAKLLVVGEPSAGKTSLAKKLLDPTYPVPNVYEESTLGVDIHTGWKFDYTKDANIKFTANIWDFGGQQIQYMIHQFFLTSRSLYVLVVDDRKQHTEFDYWFNIIYLLGKGSPLLVVLNERSGQPVTNFDVKSYQSIYGDDLLIKCRDANLAVNDLRFDLVCNEIKQMLSELNHIGDELPVGWVKVRQELEARKAKNHIVTAEYFEICKQHGIAKETVQLSLSEYLHALGVILHFQEDRGLSGFVILNPQWAVEAVYSILSERKLRESGGRFSKKWLFDVWGQAGYNFEERNQLLSLMQKDRFELCYLLPSSEEEEYLAPQLLPSSKPTYEWDDNDNLQFRFVYPFMPKGIIARLIVRLHKYVDNDASGRSLAWEKGVIFIKESVDSDATSNAVRAEVIEGRTEHGQKVIHIRISAAVGKKELLTIIREEINNIHRQSFKKIRSQEMIPCNCLKCEGNPDPHFFEYEMLSRFIREQKTAQCYKSGTHLSPLSLVDDVLGTEQFIKDEQDKGSAVEKVKFVIDKFVYQEPGGTIIMEENVKQEKVISIGQNATVSAPVIIADSIQNSFNTLAEAQINDDLKSLLDQLLKSVTEINKQAPQDKASEAEEMARDAEALVKEAASSKPRRKWYEVSLEGLKEAATSIGSIAIPVLDVLNKLRPLLLP